MSFSCDRCPEQGYCAKCRERKKKADRLDSVGVKAKKIISAATQGISPEKDPWLLHPDDGVIDRLAISIAVYGERRVKLSYSERLVAAKTLLRHGSTIAALCVRLTLPYIVSEDLTCRTKMPPQNGKNTAA
jgi:hypothetical protein